MHNREESVDFDALKVTRRLAIDEDSDSWWLLQEVGTQCVNRNLISKFDQCMPLPYRRLASNHRTKHYSPMVTKRQQKIEIEENRKEETSLSKDDKDMIHLLSTSIPLLTQLKLVFNRPINTLSR